MAFTGLAIAAALALAKNKLVDQPMADKQRKLAAATQAYSPWTGNKAGPVNEPNLAGDLLSYGATGASIGSGVAKQNAADALATKSAGGAAGGSPWAVSGNDYTQPMDFWGKKA